MTFISTVLAALVLSQTALAQQSHITKDVNTLLNEALSIARSFKKPPDQAKALVHIAEAKFEIGDLPVAENILAEAFDAVADEDPPATTALVRISKLWARMGQASKAIEIANQVPKDSARGIALSHIVKAQASAGDIEGAQDTLSRFGLVPESDVAGDYVWAQVQIAKAQKVAGDEVSARKTFADAARIARKHPDSTAGRGTSLRVIVEAQSDVGLLSDARATIDVLIELNGHAYQIDVAWGAIAVAMANNSSDVDSWANAVSLAERINSPEERARRLGEIAAIASSKNQERDADNLFQEAITIALETDGYGRAFALSEIADALGRAGRMAQARDALSRIPEDKVSYRARSLAKIAVEYANAGRDERASTAFKEAISIIQDNFMADRVLPEIARMQAESGFFADAVETAESVSAGPTPDIDRVRALAAILPALNATKNKNEPGEAPEPTIVIGGMYRVEGTNPNGTTYTGVAEVTPLGEGKYRFHWKIGAQRYTGTGALRDEIISVDYGDSYPAIYKIEPSGTLNGTWADGRGIETLFPKD